MGYILSIDLGTTSVRAVIVSKEGKILAIAKREITQYYPNHGFVEHDPEEIWQSLQETIRKVLHFPIKTIGIANQRETTILWDRTTSKPIWNAIVWQDSRTKDACKAVKKYESLIHQKTGLRISPFFSATKIAWILDHLPNAREKAEKGELCFGTVDSYILWKLTEGKVFKTDVSNASRTLLFNINELKWDDELLSIFQIPKKILAEVAPSSHFFGSTSSSIFPNSIPISSLIGDQQAALFAHSCFEKGTIQATYGTCCSILMNIGSKPLLGNPALLTTIGWQIEDKTTYALEGFVFSAGSIIKWFRDSWGIIQEPQDLDELATRVPDSGGVYFVPAITGLGTPQWNIEAKGMILGLRLSTNLNHLARAALEGIAHQVSDTLDLMQEVTKKPIKILKVGGGMSKSKLLLQIQSDISSLKIARSENPEMTVLGAAFLAGLSIGFWKNCEEIALIWKSDATFNPKLPLENIENMRSSWKKALTLCEEWT
jgi:glycerol kinase